MWKEYAVHYAVVLLVYAIMFGVVLWHIQTPRRRRRAARTGDAPPRNALVQDIPPEALRTLTRDSFTQSLLEMRMLDDVLAARGAAYARPRDVLLVAHPAMPTDTRLIDRYPTHRFRHCATFAGARAPSDSLLLARERRVAQQLEHAAAVARSYDVVYSLFAANCRDGRRLCRHVLHLWACATPRRGTVLARILLRDRRDRDAVVACFEERFADVRYGLVNYALFFGAHVPAAASMLWHDLRRDASRSGVPPSRRVQWGEWWHYGQLFVVARAPLAAPTK